MQNSQSLSKKEKMDVSTHHETNSQKNIAVFVTKEPLCLRNNSYAAMQNH